MAKGVSPTTVLTLVVLLCKLSVASHDPNNEKFSVSLEEQIEQAEGNEQVSGILFLDHRLTMDDVYPEALALPMGPRRAYVARVLKDRFAQMSQNVMKFLEDYKSKGDVTILRPLWILNGIRITASPWIFRALSDNFIEVVYICADPVFENTLDNGWGTFEIGSPQIWSQFGARGLGVVVGHKDSGINYVGCSRFEDRIWINEGEDIDHNGRIDESDANGLDDDGNGYIDDFHGWGFDHDNNVVIDNDPFNQGYHGTRTASVISSNNIAVDDTVSVAPEAKLMILRGFLTQGAVFESSQYALEKGANVISASLSFKQNECGGSIRECPNRVAHRWVSEMELAAGIIHANSTGNLGCGSEPRPLCLGTPSDGPPPAITDAHWQQGGVSSIVSVAAYSANGSYDETSRRGPGAWSRQDVCVDPRVPFCGPVGTPSEYPLVFEDYPYHDGSHGLLKPDLTAPTGVEAVSGSCGQGSISGTSGATPHVGGALALIYSAFPGITPEEAYLVLVNGALDAGDVGPDTTWGFGKLRLLPAIAEGRQDMGSVAGTVTASQGGQPLSGVRVTVAGAQAVWTNSSGQYQMYLQPGSYTGTYEKFGYQTVSRQINIVAGQVDEGSLTLASAANASLALTVRDPYNQPANDIAVRHVLSETTVYTDHAGIAQFDVMYDGEQEFVIAGNVEQYTTMTFAPTLQAGANDLTTQLTYSELAGPTGPDLYGYYAYDDLDAGGPDFDWVELADGTGTNLNLTGDNCTSRTLPFSMMFYGSSANEIMISANGHIEVGTPCTNEWSRWPIPVQGSPDNYISVFWQDYRPEQGGGVWYYNDAAHGRVVVQWEDVPEYFNSGRATFQVHIYDPAVFSGDDGNSVIDIFFLEYSGRLETSVGIENSSGTDGLQYAFQLNYSPGAAPIRAGRGLRFTTDYITSADDVPGVMPKQFVLQQNYPNPFNASTTFRFDVPQESRVALKLFDVTGRQVATVFDGQVSAGQQSVNFDATGLATGLYFARLEAQGKSVQTRKILFLK